MKKTKKAYETYLNDLYADTMGVSDFIDQFIYFKSGKIETSKLIDIYTARKGGAAIRRYDPIAFQVGFNEWIP